MSFRVKGIGLLLALAFAAGMVHTGAEAATSWSGLRGPSWDGSVRDAKLLDPGTQAALAVTWKQPLGSGYSGVVAADGRVATMFATADADVAAAFDAASGKELWRYRIADAYKGHDGSHDGPISTPLIDKGRLYGLGPRGQLFALDMATGKQVWARNVVDEHGAKAPFYGFTSSPILVDGVLVVEIGGGAGKAVGGFSPDDGRLLWSVGDDEINYHSPIAATIGGRLQVVAVGGATLLGIDAASGKVLWSHAHQGDKSAMGGESEVPVPAGEGRFLLLNKGDSSVMVRVEPDGASGYKVSEAWTSNAMRGSYVIPVYHDGYLYGMTGRIFTCLDAATGEAKWKSREPGDGFPTLVGRHLVIITKPGTLHVAEASPEGYKELARLDLFKDHSWAAVAWADGHMYARSMGHIARIDLAAAPAAPSATNWVASTEFGRFLEDTVKAADRKAAVDAFLAKQKSFPIVEESGAVHFIYRGEAKDVGIVGDIIGSRREDPMKKLEGTDLFYYSTRLEPDAAVTYGFIVDYGKAAADPLNARAGKGLFGDVSFLSMPAWRDADFAAEAPAERQGRVEDLEWESAAMEKKKRTAKVYLPAGYDREAARRYPVLYVPEGKDALEQGLMKNALDHLTGQRVAPMIAVFIMPDAENPRSDQGEKYQDMIVKELVPAIDGKYRTQPQASSRAIAGAGGAGTTALFLAFSHPDVFSRIGSLSAMVMDLKELDPLIAAGGTPPLVIYMDWGTYHLRSPHEAWDMGRGNRALWALLRERGQRPTGGEAAYGFGWSCWRPKVPDMLAALFPQPAAQGASPAAPAGGR
ncbi:MAG: PQQ-binding-like beta-propeller repeat protein [Candidatus Polarisedimenticolia bacterium]